MADDTVVPDELRADRPRSAARRRSRRRPSVLLVVPAAIAILFASVAAFGLRGDARGSGSR